MSTAFQPPSEEEIKEFVRIYGESPVSNYANSQKHKGENITIDTLKKELETIQHQLRLLEMRRRSIEQLLQSERVYRAMLDAWHACIMVRQGMSGKENDKPHDAIKNVG